MRVYFTESQVPELAGLNRSQRKIVRRGALEMLRRDQPSLLDSVRLLNAGQRQLLVVNDDNYK